MDRSIICQSLPTGCFNSYMKRERKEYFKKWRAKNKDKVYLYNLKQRNKKSKGGERVNKSPFADKVEYQKNYRLENKEKMLAKDVAQRTFKEIQPCQECGNPKGERHRMVMS